MLTLFKKYYGIPESATQSSNMEENQLYTCTLPDITIDIYDMVWYSIIWYYVVHKYVQTWPIKIGSLLSQMMTNLFIM